jgi:glycosidase
MRTFSLLLLLLATTLHAQQIRIEPPNWWTGMQNPRVQLLLHSPNISQLHPRISYPGLHLERSIRTENPNYLFLDLLIEPQARPGTVQIDFIKDGQTTALSIPWQLQPRETGASSRKGFDASDVLYLITPDRFANGNPQNDGLPGMLEAPDRKNKGGRHGGDIEGVRQHLDYLADLGITALWLNPLLENNMQDYSYHGYATTDFYKVDPRFGSNESYRQLTAEARSKGIKMVMDMIVNHCGSLHWWMNDLPSANWLNSNFQTDPAGTGNGQPPAGYVETNHRKTVVQDPHAATADRQQFFDGWFVSTMPDLNQRNPLLATYLIQNSIWWVEYAGLNGIRMDTYPYPDPDFMSEWSCRLMEEYPSLNIVGEEWNLHPAIVSYWQKDKLNPNGYTSCLPSLMDFPGQQALADALTAPESWSTGWIRLYETIAQDFLYPHPDELVVFPDNHDMPRFFAQVGRDVALFKLGLVFFLTSRGIPQIYYGTEILMDSPSNRDDGLIRSDFPGGWPGDAVNGFTGQGLKAEQLEIQSFLKKMLAWRRTAPAIHRGKLTHFAPENGMYVYFRHSEQQRVMVVLNKDAREKTLWTARFAELLDGFSKGRDVISGKTQDLAPGLVVPAKGALVLVLE